MEHYRDPGGQVVGGQGRNAESKVDHLAVSQFACTCGLLWCSSRLSLAEWGQSAQLDPEVAVQRMLFLEAIALHACIDERSGAADSLGSDGAHRNDLVDLGDGEGSGHRQIALVLRPSQAEFDVAKGIGTPAL